MTDQTPQLSQNASEPKGVIRKNIKMFVYLGAILLLITASLFSSKKKTPNGTPAKGTPPQPFVQDNTANNIADLQNQLAAEKQKQQQDAQLAEAMAESQTPAQQQAAAMYGPNGQPNMPPPQGQPQNGQLRRYAELLGDSEIKTGCVYISIPRSAAMALDRVLRDVGLLTSKHIRRLHIPNCLIADRSAAHA